jgi:hypothetical protein
MVKKKKTIKKKKAVKKTANKPIKNQNTQKEKLVFILIFILVFSLSYYIGFKIISSRNIDTGYYYDYLDFEKTTIEEFDFYKTNLENYKGETFEYYLSNSPERLAKVEMYGEIDLNKNLYIFPETALEKCDAFEILSIHQFSIPLFQISGLSTEMRRLEKENLSKYKDDENIIIIIRKASFFQSPQIKQVDENLFEIQVKGCDLGLVYEKFVLESYINYKFV